MAEAATTGGKNVRNKAIIASILAVVAIGFAVGIYYWQKGEFQSEADVELQLDREEEQAINEGDEEATVLPGNEWRVGNNRVALRSGTLVKLQSDPRVYLIYRGTKQLITNATVFEQLGLKWSNITGLPDDNAEYLDKYENGPNIEKYNPEKLPNGLVVKFDDNPGVFQVIANKLKPYPAGSVFMSRNPGWEVIAGLPSSERRMAYDVVPFRYRGGNLVKEADKPAVYWVAGAKRYPIDSPEEMDRWGLRYENIILAEPGVLQSTNPEAKKPMYAVGRSTSSFTRTFLPLYLFMQPNDNTVFLFKYDNGPKDLVFNNATIFQNRFKWTEIAYKHPKRTRPGVTPTPSSSTTTPTTLPNGQVKCTVSGQARYTYWKEINLTDYAKNTYPKGITKMYEVKRADSAGDPGILRVIYNIKNQTKPNSNTFSAGDKIAVTLDVIFTHGRNGATQINSPGEFRTALRNIPANTSVRDWIFDEIGDLQVDQHKAITKPDYTLPANLNPNTLGFWSRYNYYAGDNDWCHWPATSENPYLVFPKLNP